MLGPAREPDAELTALHEDVAASLQAMLEEVYLHLVERAAGSARRLRGPLPRRRRRAERRRQRPDPTGDAVRGGLRPAGGRRLRHRGRRGATTSGTRSSGKPRGFVMEHAYSGPEYSDEECAAALAAAGLEARAARRRRACSRTWRSGSPPATSSAGSRAGWSSGRARSATARSSPIRDGADMKDILNARIKHREPFRPFAPSILAERDRRVVRAGLPVAVHGARLQDADREARARSRRSTTSTTPAACRRSSRGVESALLPADRGVRAADRRADPAQHLVQRERADRDDAGARGRDVPEDHGWTCSCSATTWCAAPLQAEAPTRRRRRRRSAGR